MKITVDARTVMKNTTDYIFDDLKYDFPPTEIELTDDPNDYMKDLTKITREYKDEFIRCLEMDFVMRMIMDSQERLAEHGLDIITKEDS
ncbi:MAG: hypothetical protein E6732_06680 [Enterococcus faecalis]|nr:hypothetical protein [Enterococcus faecalis]MDU5814381.1 hypothetical protein [Enterococcus casseliflavus]